MDMVQQIIQLVTVLFLLSMLCERIADFLKHYLCGSKVFKIGDTVTRYNDDIKEGARAYRILKINVWSGFMVAAIVKADIIKIFNSIQEPGKVMGWNNMSEYTGFFDYVLLVLGIFLTGCFISFGSKFWHDLLDLLYQIKNTKRVLADTETYKVDNIKSLEKIYNTYQSDFIKAAYLEAKTQFLAMDSVKAISIKNNDLGYYFELTLSRNDAAIPQLYQYHLDDGATQSIPIRTVLLPPGQTINALSVDLSSKIFALNNATSFGTFGVLVKPLSGDTNKRYLMTCCHNVLNPATDLPYKIKVKAGTFDQNLLTLGEVIQAERDHEIDGALIDIDSSLLPNIHNYIPQLGKPNGVRQLFNSDANHVDAFVYGAVSGPLAGKALSGKVTSIYSSIKLTYSGDEFTIINMLAISNQGRAISDKGDSGACVVDENNYILGLVVAGCATTTYVIPIQTLLTKLKVELA